MFVEQRDSVRQPPDYVTYYEREMFVEQRDSVRQPPDYVTYYEREMFVVRHAV